MSAQPDQTPERVPTTKLEERVRARRQQREILLISHAVLGYPSFDTCEAAIDEMMARGVDIVELQVPFSDPQADGPFFTHANQVAVDGGTSVDACFDFAAATCARHPEGNFVIMTYFNILYQYGVSAFVERAAAAGVQGFIIPDLPVEEADEYVAACDAHGLAPIFLFTPATSPERMREVARHTRGFVYCQARFGVTGNHTEFDDAVDAYIERCRAATALPIAMGFGIQTRADVDFLRGKIDIAICCTQAVRVMTEQGVPAMGGFLAGLRD
ncbi:tryptophan synthase subunit alpha [Haliangium ochraceum]|uniref:tryptophan synthase subunit alpha n=1 Tax=Haliangium ochraceum TaxID=80816 RepID=UPI00019B9792|nr:tryptophan synthase subunit alpha [Haliangium ochraceum]